VRWLRACFVPPLFFWIFLKICLFRVLKNSRLTHEEALESENVQNVSALNAQLLRRERERENCLSRRRRLYRNPDDK